LHLHPAPTLALQPPQVAGATPTSPAHRPRRPQPLPPAHPPRRPFPGPTDPNNRSPRTQGPSPARARSAPANGSPEFGLPAPAGHPRGHIAKPNFFPRASLQKGNSNSKVTFLILVNSVENRRKIRKMQNQFCYSW
jgi:hypothetical protein